MKTTPAKDKYMSVLDVCAYYRSTKIGCFLKLRDIDFSAFSECFKIFSNSNKFKCDLYIMFQIIVEDYTYTWIMSV